MNEEKSYWCEVPIPKRCEGCPYGRAGFVCYDSSKKTCMRTDVEILEKQQKGDE